MFRLSSSNAILLLALVVTGADANKFTKLFSWRQSDPTVSDCSDEMYASNCANKGHREFCDHDASVLMNNIPRSICAPVSSLKFLVQEGDYCGKCKPPEGLVIDFFFPSKSPSAAPTAADKPIGGTDGAISPDVPRSLAPFSLAPTVGATAAPSVVASAAPSGSSFPSAEPSSAPSVATSGKPSGSSLPSSVPSDTPTITASAAPSGSSSPSSTPTDTPSGSSFPSSTPTNSPSGSSLPSSVPSDVPTVFLKTNPLETPSPSDSSFPSSVPSGNPSGTPSNKPSGSSFPSSVPSGKPSSGPSAKPSGSSLPSAEPSGAPSVSFPTENPTASPTVRPPVVPVDEVPTSNPTASPTGNRDIDIPTGGSGGDGPTRQIPADTTVPIANPTVSPPPSVSANPSNPEPPVVDVTTRYSFSFSGDMTDKSIFLDSPSMIKEFEETVRDFLNINQPLDDFRGTVIIKVTVLDQRLSRRRLRALQEMVPMTIDLKIDGVVSPDDALPYSFENLVAGVFSTRRLVLRNDLNNKGIMVEFA